jgi:hypothetical protein
LRIDVSIGRGGYAPFAMALVVLLGALEGCSHSQAADRRAAGPAAVPLAEALRSRPGNVSMFPPPGSRTASPQTQITFRGRGPLDTRTIVITGSSTGVHSGRFESHSDGGGISFLPAQPFTPGETVTVSSTLPIRGQLRNAASFVVAKPARETTPPPRPTPTAPPPPTPVTSRFISAPKLRAPMVTVTTAKTRGPSSVLLVTKGAGLLPALMIVDRSGGLTWYQQMPDGTAANDLKVQRYQGRFVLTYWRGTQNTSHGYGGGDDIIVDRHYQQLAVVHAGNGYHADLHDFVLTSAGSAWLTAYTPVRWDLRPVNGRGDGIVLDGVVQEVDLRTGLVKFEWHSLDHIPLAASTVKPPPDNTTAWDYAHLNSVDPSEPSEVLVSARHTSAVYAVDGDTGDVRWTLGGDYSDFNVPAAARFGYQHDARRAGGKDLISIFDDGGGPPRTEPQSRALVVHLDRRHKAVAVVAADTHAPPVVANSQGNVERLSDGSLFVGWGSEPAITEFDGEGTVDWDARLPAGVSSYRAFSDVWEGAPTTAPAVVVRRVAGRQRAWVSWNGDTRTATWRVTVASAAATRTFTVRRRGFETTIEIPHGYSLRSIVPLDARGRTLR